MACTVANYPVIGGGVFHHGMQNPRPRPVRLIKWEAPISGTFKINVDGSSLGNPGKAGIGGLIRDTNGNWIVGFAGSIGFSKILYAELSAIKKGLELAWEKGCRRVICETDSMKALQLVEEADVDGHMHGVVIGEIRRLCQRKWEVYLVHVLREGNQCADFLAKLGSKSNCDFRTWDEPLLALKQQLKNDAKGVCYCRS